jgi:hypothetical protein
MAKSKSQKERAAINREVDLLLSHAAQRRTGKVPKSLKQAVQARNQSQAVSKAVQVGLAKAVATKAVQANAGMTSAHPDIGGQHRGSYQGASMTQNPFVRLDPFKCGSTPAGRAWALNAALHPCGAGEIISSHVGDLVGMPDTMTGAVVTPRYSGETQIKFDRLMFATPPTTGFTTWGADIIIPPIPEIDYIYRLYNDGATEEASRVSKWNVVRLANFTNPEVDPATGVAGVTMSSVGYGRVRCIGSGHTFELDASATNDQGRVVAAQLAGQWTDMQINPPVVTQTTGSFVTQVTPDVTFGDALVSIRARGGKSTSNVQILTIPTQPEVLVTACPSVYQGQARDGAYVVTKFSSPLLGYQFAKAYPNSVYTMTGTEGDTTRAAVSYFQIQADEFGIDPVNIAFGDPLTTNSTLFYDPTGPTPFGEFDGDSIGLTQDRFHPFVSGRSEMMTGVITFRNMVITDGATASGATASIRVKSENYFECIPHAMNPASTPFTHQPAPYDMKALEAVIVAGKQLGDAYPASYNDLGLIINKVVDALGGAGKKFLGDVKDMDLPVVSQLAGLLSGINL